MGTRVQAAGGTNIDVKEIGMTLSRHIPAQDAAVSAPTACPAVSRFALLNTGAAAAIALFLWAGGALAQEAQGAQAQPAQEPSQAQADAPDAIVATVGDAEIRASDVARAIGMLPRPLGSQPPPELVASAALQHLLLRQAILQKARSQDLAQDPEVQSLVEAATRNVEEDALVQVWLQRELESRVPDQSVDQAYAALEGITTGTLPPLEQVRPEIEENLRRQAIEEIRRTLLTGAEITFYGPDGRPMSAEAGEAGAQAAGAQGGGAGQGGASGQPPQDQGAQAAAGGQAGEMAADQTPPQSEAAGQAGGGQAGDASAGQAQTQDSGSGNQSATPGEQSTEETAD